MQLEDVPYTARQRFATPTTDDCRTEHSMRTPFEHLVSLILNWIALASNSNQVVAVGTDPKPT